MIWFILLYIVTIVSANIIVSYWQAASYVIALVFIGLDLTLKDKFQINLKWYQVFGIMLLGGILTFIINASFMPIAIASTTALLCAFTVDYIVFSLLKNNKYARVMVSNIFGSFADSLVFAYLAPFPFTWGFVLTMTALKIVGGSIAGYILVRRGVL